MKRGIFTALHFLVSLSAGWSEEVPQIDGKIPNPNDIQVLIDPSVIPPLVDNKNLEKKGRIVINFHKDGSLTGKDKQALESDEAIKNYIEKEKSEFVAAGKEPVMHLRGEKDVIFKESRKVIKIAHNSEVDRVIFAVYQQSEEKPETFDKVVDKIEVVELPIQKGWNWMDAFIRPREHDLNMALPADDKAGKFEGKEVVILVNALGQVYIGKDKVALDQDPQQKEMPLLKAELEKMKGDGQAISVSVYVEPETAQHRVISLLNTLAAVNISTVKFTDQIEN